MKKNGLIFLAYAAAAAVYAAITLILAYEASLLFWLALFVPVVSCALSAAVTVLFKSENPSFAPSQISAAASCAVYAAVSMVISVVLAIIFKASVTIFAAVHILCLVVFAAAVLAQVILKRRLQKDEAESGIRLKEVQSLIFEFEKIKNRIPAMPGEVRGQADSLIDSIIEELRFSDFSSQADTSSFDEKIRWGAKSLAAETETLIEIQADDITGFRENAQEILRLVKDRNLQIKSYKQGT